MRLRAGVRKGTDASDAPAVVLHDLTFWYPGAPLARPALGGVSLDVRLGELVVLCGPSGGGKSTLLRLLLGLVPQFSGGRLAGEVSTLGLDPTRVPPRCMAEAGVGLVFQNPAESFVAERVAEEVAFGPENLGVDGREIDARVAESLRTVGLAGCERRHTRSLSDRQQQRVALAAALALRPRLLLLDEPTAHLDVATAEEILALVATLHRTYGTTIMLAEHRLGLVARFAERVVVVSGGQVLADGPPREALAEPGLVALGVPVPRAAQAAGALGVPPPLPLTPPELAERILEARREGAAREGREPAAEGSLGPRAGTRAWTASAARACGPTGGRGSDGVALDFDRVSFAYPDGQRALSDVSFRVARGEVVAVIGPSGAGKSTLGRLALGLLRSASGTVHLGGLRTDRTPLSRLATLGGLVLQNPLHQLLADRVDRELMLGVLDLPAVQARERVEELLLTFDLVDLRDRHPLALSEGQRRRVALAAVLVRRPRVLVLDEPTLGQDELQRHGLAVVVRSLAEGGSTVVAITHDAEFVNDACDRVLALRAGKLEADAPTELGRTDPGRLAALGVPLADVPATALCLRRRGLAVAARDTRELVKALAG